MTVVVQHTTNIAALNHRSAGIPNEFLNLVKQEMVKLLSRQRVPGFQSLNVFFWKRHANAVAFG